MLIPMNYKLAPNVQMPYEIDEDWLVTWTGEHPGSVSHIEYMTDQW